MNRGRLSLVRPHAEEKSRTDESQLRAAHAALATARESILGMELQLEAERRARQDAEERIRIEQQACQEAMRLLEQTVEPLRDLKAAVAEHERRAELEAQARAELEADRHGAEAELCELDATLTRTLEHAEHFKHRLESESRARHAAEFDASTERLARDEALRAMVHAQNLATEQQVLAEEHARAYAEFEARVRALEAQLETIQASLESALESAEESRIHMQVERQAREEAESRVQVEREAREEIRRALLVMEHAAEDQKRAQGEFKKRRRALEAELKEMEGALAQAEYLADLKAQRLSQVSAELEAERCARQEGQAHIQGERDVREETVPKSRRTWKKLLAARR
jgi:colicin import membrane protein